MNLRRAVFRNLAGVGLWLACGCQLVPAVDWAAMRRSGAVADRPPAAEVSEIPSPDLCTGAVGQSRFAGDHWLVNRAFDPSSECLPAVARVGRVSRRWRFADPDGRDATASDVRHQFGLPPRTSLEDGLAAVAADPTRPPRTRAAAVEAWSVRLQERRKGEASFAPIAASAGAVDIGLRAEALRSLGRGVQPQRVPAIAAAAADWSSQPAEIREAVVDACLLYAATSRDPRCWPDGLEAARFDPSPRVRTRYGRLLAVCDAADALEVLTAQGRDVDASVRNEALLSLGLLGGDDAVAALRTASKGSGERTRAAAVRGLAAAGIADAGRDDPSALVREAAAEALVAVEVDRVSVRAAEALACDADRAVQVAALRAVAAWADEGAVPVLLAAIGGASFNVRRDALDTLRERTGITEPLLIEASAADRRSILSEWAVRFDLSTATSDPVSAPGSASSPDLAWAVHRVADGDASAGVLSVLRTLTVNDLPSLERLVREQPELGLRLWPTPLWTTVLPAVRADLAAVQQMAGAAPSARVAGAERLARFAQSQTPSSLVTGRLPDLMRGEQNARTWRAILSTLSRDAGGVDSPLGRVLPEALNAAWPDVRRLACETAAAQPDPAFAAWLRPLLTDADASVRAAAASAAGACGNPAVLDGLRRQMADDSATVRRAATEAAVRLGDETALAELLRQAHDTDVRVRRAAAEAIGRVVQPDRAVAVLSLAWAETDADCRGAYEAFFARHLGPASGDRYETRLDHWASAVQSPGL